MRQFLPLGAASLAMSEGKLDAFVFVAGYPVTAISELAKNVDIEPGGRRIGHNVLPSEDK